VRLEGGEAFCDSDAECPSKMESVLQRDVALVKRNRHSARDRDINGNLPGNGERAKPICLSACNVYLP